MQSRSRRHASVIFLSYPCAATETSIAAWAASHAYRRKADEIGTSLESAPIGPPQCRHFLPPAGPAPREGPGRQPGWSLRRDRTHHAAAADIGGNHFCPGDGRQTSYPSDGGIDRAPAAPWLRPDQADRLSIRALFSPRRGVFDAAVSSASPLPNKEVPHRVGLRMLRCVTRLRLLQLCQLILHDLGRQRDETVLHHHLLTRLRQHHLH